MKYLKVLFVLVFTIFVRSNEGYRILCVFPYEGKSHFVMFEVLCKGLAKRGHQIDMISHFPTKKSIVNYTDIVDLSGTRKQVVNSLTIDMGRQFNGSGTYYISTTFGIQLCEIMGCERMQKFIRNPPNDPPYDLVITEYFGSRCYLGFGPFFNVPVVVAATFVDMAAINDFMGNPNNYAFYSGPNYFKPVVDTFFDRLWNFLINFKELHLFYHYTSDQTEIMRKYLGQHLPDIDEIERNVSLALTYGHHSMHGARPMTPAIVEVGGLHVEADKSELTTELKEWLDSADQGVVYFSLGSMLTIETLPQSTLLDLYASFAKIAPVKVLMKCANATRLPHGLPSNVITSPWIPQIAVLKHKNTRVFITHGGLMGTQEAVYCGIPMIGIPVFADQLKNVNALVAKNMAILMHLDDISERSMDAALKTILHDPKYMESAKKASKLFHDRPMSAIDTAVYWIEYVIRNGPDSLKTPVASMPWWKLYLVDVFSFLIIGLLMTVCLLVSLHRLLLRKFRNNDIKFDKKSK